MSEFQRKEGAARQGSGLLPGAEDTIAAVATAPGRGAIALLRVSGPRALELGARVLSPWPVPERSARLCALRHPDAGVLVDRAVATVYRAPRSYTGEDMLEIATHGGQLVPTLALAALVAAGAREALPGEFTRRAVANGKMDVLQAEAVGDLVDARSRASHSAALGQMDGGLSRRVLALRGRLLELEALIAYDIDFPEEDDGPVSPERIARACEESLAALDALLATAPAGELLREGATVVIAGAPNAGKSSLFNALLGRARALVTEVPGTTRDAIEAVLDDGRWPLRLVDTAGLRETADVVERLGIEVSERYLAEAHVVLACAERDAELEGVVARVRGLTAAPVVAVRTKGDVGEGGGAVDDGAREAAAARSGEGARGAPPEQHDTRAVRADHHPSIPDQPPVPRVRVSAETGEGLRALLAAVDEAIADRYGAPPLDAPLLTRERHQAAIRRARAELADFADAWRLQALPLPVAAVHLRSAVGALEELIGAVDVEDVLERVFSQFCVGK